MLSTAADMPGPLHITLIGESFSIYHIYLLINLPAADTNSCSVYFMNRTHTHTYTHFTTTRACKNVSVARESSETLNKHHT